MNLRKLNLDGFYLNQDVETTDSSIMYDSEKFPETWISLVWDTYETNRLIVTFIVDGETKAITTFINGEIDYLESQLNAIIKDIFKD